MIKNIINNFKNLDTLAKVIMKKGIIACLILTIISSIILATYNFYFTIPILYLIGFNLFKLSLIFGTEFVICGFAADKIKSQLI